MDILEKLGLDDNQFINQQTISDLISPLSKADLLKETQALELGEFSLDNREENTTKLAFGGDASASIQLFNSTEDDDSDDLLASSDTDAIIPFDANEPVIKYKIQLKAEGNVGTRLGDLDIGLEGDAMLEAMAYIKHSETDVLGTALVSDIKNFPSVLSLEEVAAISNGSALALETEAKLAGSLSFDFSEVFTAGLSGLAELLESDKLISVDISKGLKVSANYSFKDTYQLVIVKDNSEGYEFLVSVNKSKSSKLSASSTASIGISFSEPEVFSSALNKQLDRLVSQLVEISDEGYEKAKLWLASNQEVASLSSELRLTVDQLTSYFSIEDIPDKYQQLKNKLDEFNKKVKEAVTKEAKNKLRVSIGFEYSRIASSSTLLKARIKKEILAQNSVNGKSVFSNLVLFNPNPLIEEASSTDTSQIRVEDFLKEHMTKEEANWGISIGFGKFKIGGSDEVSKEFNVAENIDGDLKVSFNGVRGYKEVGTLGGFSDQWSVGFNPTMDDFAHGNDPKPKDFDNSFALRMQHYDKKFKSNNSEKGRMIALVDTAVCWGIINEDKFDSTFDSIWSTLTNGKKKAPITITLNLNFTPKAFELASDQWWQLMSQPDLSLQFLAKAMARALAYNSSFEARTTPAKREAAYASAWYGYLNSTLTNDPYALAIEVEHHVQPMNNVLAQYERDMRSGSLASIVKGNPATKARWRTFNDGILNYLNDYRINEYTDYRSEIRQTFNDIKAIWAQSFDVRTFGTYLNLLGSLDNEVPKYIEGNLTIDYSDSKGQKKSMVVKKV